MNTSDELYQFANQVNDACLDVRLAFVRVYGLISVHAPIPDSEYQNLFRAIGELHVNASIFTTAIISYRASQGYTDTETGPIDAIGPIL